MAALGAVHAGGVLHGDARLSNLMLVAPGAQVQVPPHVSHAGGASAAAGGTSRSSGAAQEPSGPPAAVQLVGCGPSAEAPGTQGPAHEPRVVVIDLHMATAGEGFGVDCCVCAGWRRAEVQQGACQYCHALAWQQRVAFVLGGVGCRCGPCQPTARSAPPSSAAAHTHAATVMGGCWRMLCQSACASAAIVARIREQSPYGSMSVISAYQRWG